MNRDQLIGTSAKLMKLEKRSRGRSESLILAVMILLVFMNVILQPARAEAFTIPLERVLIIAKTELYEDPSTASKVVGAIAPFQTVKVVGRDTEEDSMEDAGWLLVSTWLGDKWIQVDERVQNGSFLKAQQSLTSVYELTLYNRPDANSRTSYRLTPQKLQANARLSYSPLTFPNATALITAGETTWYCINTWLGEKWILNPALLEDVKEQEVSYAMKLTGDELTYPSPYQVESSAELLPAQTVSVSAIWETGFGPSSVTWYKIELPNGQRWLSPSHETIIDYASADEQLTLPTETRYFAGPLLQINSEGWLEPGTYDVFETSSGDWKHIKLQTGSTVWVNPSRALLERPVGIELTKEDVALTEETETYRYPLTGEIAHVRGFYAPQMAEAFEKWEADDGSIWFHIHGFGGDEWLKQSQ
ncbi:hypothetical protein [Paenibacillus sp. HB172176]|uniref:hypothetical protein n=1 Tax=Paenibacillus sp. HB172176 TaxID=2493690 RepID=UPI0014395543|nr:hypothetical protein [Paenibacillus sp. HB172176]